MPRESHAEALCAETVDLYETDIEEGILFQSDYYGLTDAEVDELRRMVQSTKPTSKKGLATDHKDRRTLDEHFKARIDDALLEPDKPVLEPRWDAEPVSAIRSRGVGDAGVDDDKSEDKIYPNQEVAAKELLGKIKQQIDFTKFKNVALYLINPSSCSIHSQTTKRLRKYAKTH